MTGTTVELALKTAVDADDLADYLTISEVANLQTLDALFSNTTGHNHGGAHQGGPITAIPITALPDGSVTSAKIADGTIATGDLANGAVTTDKIAAGAVSNVQIAQFSGVTMSSTIYSALTGAITIDMSPSGGVIAVVLFGAAKYSGSAGRAQYGIKIDSGSVQDCSRPDPSSVFVTSGGVATASVATGSHTVTAMIRSVDNVSIVSDGGFMVAIGLKR